MAARGILQNPALYSGVDTTPLSCIQDWIDMSVNSKIQFQCFHHHLVFMLEKVLNRRQRKVFNHLKTFEKVISFLEENLGIKVPSYSEIEKVHIEYSDEKDGSYFQSKLCVNDDIDIEDYIGDFCTIVDNV